MENQTTENVKTKFCKHCGAKIPEEAVLCTACGRQVEELKGAAQPSIVINNENTNANMNMNVVGGGRFARPRNKWVALILCLLLGFVGAHKFYEGRTGMGILYIFTGGLLGIGWVIDIIALICKPNPYYV